MACQCVGKPLVLVSIMFVYVHAAIAGDPDTAEWQRLMSHAAQEISLPQSVQLEFELHGERLGPDGSVVRQTHQVLRYKKQGKNTYWASTLELNVTGKGAETVRGMRIESGNSSLETAYDGQMYRTRAKGNADPGDTIAMSRKDSGNAPSPLPWQFAALTPMDALLERIREGALRPREVETVGGSKRKIVVEYVRTGKPSSELVVDMQLGGLPIEGRIYNEDGYIATEISDIAISSFVTKSGNVYYVPVAATRKNYYRGKVVDIRKLTVKSESVVFDEDISADRFRLDVKPGDTIYDSDLGKVVWSTDKAMESLTTAIPNPAPPLQIPPSSMTPSVSEDLTHTGKYSSQIVPVVGAIAAVTAILATVVVVVYRRRRNMQQ